MKLNNKPLRFAYKFPATFAFFTAPKRKIASEYGYSYYTLPTAMMIWRVVDHRFSYLWQPHTSTTPQLSHYNFFCKYIVPYRIHYMENRP